MKNIRKLLALTLSLAMLLGVLFVTDIGINISADATTSTVVWDGTASASFASGDGTKENPYIIKTPMQLYKMVLDGGKKTDGTPAYYKVADGIAELNLSNNVLKTAAQIKAIGDGLATNSNLNWTKSNIPAFKGNFDGNGVTVTGMISKPNNGSKSGLIPWLGTYSVVKNINFDGCYVNGSVVGILSSNVTAIKDDNDDGTEDGGSRNSHIIIYNIAVVNSAIVASGRSGGVIASNNLADSLHITNCLYDGNSCLSSGTDFCGILGGVTYNNNFSIHNSVSIGAPISVTLKSTGLADNANYNDYSTNNRSGHPIFIYYSYSDKDIANLTTDNVVSDFTASTADELMKKLPLLDWASGWYVGTRKDGTPVPMPRVRTASIDILGTQSENKAVVDYNTLLGTQHNFIGATIDGLGNSGEFGRYYDLVGEGTQDNPYIINTAFQLARVIGSGGINLGQKFYFKLGNDIDLEGFQWLNSFSYYRVTDSNKQYYKYIPFEGTLDGDGHTISGLYAVGSNGQEVIWNNNPDSSIKNAGLIPKLNGGTVKNLHIRNSHIGSVGNAGAIAGSGSGTIIGCSVADSTVIGNSTVNNMLTAGEATIKNSYDAVSDTAIYYDATGAKVSAESIDYNTGIWYKGGSQSSTPKLVNHAKSMPYTDVDGDGKAYEINDAGDLTALRNNILGKPDFADIYGDVNNDGVVNIGDLVVLRREIAGSYNELDDGFWRNVELGNVEIFYGENDNYDAARKLELYLETLYDGDIQKYINNASTVYKHSNDGVKTPDGKLDIVVGYISGTDYASENAIGVNQYRIKFDNTNKVLWLQGANFTAVYQAVLEFIATVNSNGTTCEPTTTDILTLDAEKKPVTVDDKTYYQVWNDEFDQTETDGSGVNYGKWYIGEAHSEGATGVNSAYLNQQLISTGGINKLVSVSNGKLSIKRGFRSGAEGKTSDTANGYVCLNDAEIGTSNGLRNIDSSDIYFNAGTMKTAKTMMFKQGYVEIMASLPADGHAFPALWLYGAGPNRAYLNQGWTDSLFSKIYAKNPDWDGTDAINWTNTATQKYIYPTNYYELDILELMQNRSTSDPVYDYDVKASMHKWNRDGSHSEVSSNSGTWYSFRRGVLGNSYSYNRYSYNSTVETKVQSMRKYGFLWYTTASGTTLKTIIYNADGNGKNVTINASPTGSYASDIINEYMYILIDNEFYSAYKNSSGTYQQYTNHLTTGNQSYLDVDYVRLYQLDGKRDIVTIETENFNNGNHFGY